jgi:7-cyano-7-deazaguanine synthase
MIRSTNDASEFRPIDRRAVALVSGGLDSVVSLAIADKKLNIELVLFCNYGQRSLAKEQSSVIDVAGYYGLPFREVNIGWLKELSPKGMRGGDKRAGPTDTINANDVNRLDSLDAVWVPNRNGVFLNVAAAFAERYGCGTVVTGFNREEAVEFRDNTSEYVDAVNRSFEFSTRNGVRVVSYTLNLSKREILRKGIEIGIPFGTIWSCYRGGERMCGRCASCQRLKSAIDSLPDEQRPLIEFEA